MARRLPRPSPDSALTATTVRPSARRAASNAGHAVARGRQVHLVEDDHERLLEEPRVVESKLLADHVVIPAGIARGAVHDVDEDARSLDVAQERVTEARTGRRAFDETGHVGQRGTPVGRVAEVHHARGSARAS